MNFIAMSFKGTLLKLSKAVLTLLSQGCPRACDMSYHPPSPLPHIPYLPGSPLGSGLSFLPAVRGDPYEFSVKSHEYRQPLRVFYLFVVSGA